jgi:hypothetical protein
VKHILFLRAIQSGRSKAVQVQGFTNKFHHRLREFLESAAAKNLEICAVNVLVLARLPLPLPLPRKKKYALNPLCQEVPR